MRTKYDEKLREIIMSATGLPASSDVFRCLAGAVEATVFIGQIPTKTDLAAFLGTSEKNINRTLYAAMDFAYGTTEKEGPLNAWLSGYAPLTGRIKSSQLIYALSAAAVNAGLRFDRAEEEPEARKIAREYLGTLFTPQVVQTAQLFYGYNILLEYLWGVAEGLHTVTEAFAITRYANRANPVNDLREFGKIIVEYNPHLDLPTDPSALVAHLKIGLKEAVTKYLAEKSVNAARRRTETAIQIDTAEIKEAEKSGSK